MLTDHQGTPQKLVNAAKAAVWDRVQQPYGEQVSVTGAANTNLRFPGQYYDAEDGNHYNYFRDYDPTIGRYLQPDPIGQAGGLNLYLYAEYNPLKWVDPTGQIVIAWPIVEGAIIGANYGYRLYRASQILNAGVAVINNSPQSPNIVKSSYPPGYWSGDKGAAEWAQRNGVSSREGKGRFHGIKQGCKGSKPTDNYGVNPESGDVIDSDGEWVGNLGDAKSK